MSKEQLQQSVVVKSMVEKLKSMQQNGMKLSSASTALVEGKYAFIYMTTYQQLSNNNGKKMYFMVYEDVKKFLGISWRFYESVRAASSKLAEEEQESNQEEEEQESNHED